MTLSATEPQAPASPWHGYRGDSTNVSVRPPRGLTVVISRQAGARGGRIAKRLGQFLGWQVFDQEMLGYLVQNGPAQAELVSDVPAEQLAWATREHARQLETRQLGDGDQTEILRLALVLAAKGDAILVGRGLGDWLPEATTVNVRIIAPLKQRVAYFGQWLRLTPAEAEVEINARDRVRGALQAALVGTDPDDLTQYDLIANSARLGESECAELIAQAVRVKQLSPDASDPFLPRLGETEFEPA